MSEIISDGGSAFPQFSEDKIRDLLGVGKGMSLRDYFAAKAMQALIAQLYSPAMPEAQYNKEAKAKNGIAKMAYDYADGMLEAREKEKKASA